ncbi:DUF6412 domain-containing protein [Streptomyces sp. LX-29]|uniref:DUF6412 domain-containing protein n=1 Tax=Streptomyces sp. LX-29 TaxID=2900152 RepID=UPI00240DBE39|nr:DUF6412 domain-containing protein [Streptomyces sp. LX-29]WFB09282.1 DUF6412 domain-containing protein [Streptomyces sp. LX-29]
MGESTRVERVRMRLGMLLFLLTGLMLTQSGLVSAVVLSAAAAVAAATLVLCVLLAALYALPSPPGRIRTAIRDRERRTAFLPQRDPDAAGRTRPRAPGRHLPTAA